jgi:hypothetical protein
MLPPGFEPIQLKKSANPRACVFDVLAVDGTDVRPKPYAARRLVIWPLGPWSLGRPIRGHLAAQSVGTRPLHEWSRQRGGQ